MKVLLDTDTCIHLIRYQPVAMLQHLKRYAPGEVGISSITLAELGFGAERGPQRERNKTALDDFTALLDIAPFDAAATSVYGVVRAMLGVRGACEFSRIVGLHLADWLES